MTLRFKLLVLLCAAVCVAAALTGCQSSTRLDQAFRDESERQREARKIAAKADELRRDGEYEAAIGQYRASVAKAGNLPHVWNNLGLALSETGNYADAVSAYTVAAELTPNDPRPVTNMGLAYLNAGWASDAMVYFERALRIDPAHTPALRFSIVAADTLQRAEPQDLERVRQALLTETDPEWRKYFERHRFLFEDRRRMLDEAEAYNDV